NPDRNEPRNRQVDLPECRPRRDVARHIAHGARRRQREGVPVQVVENRDPGFQGVAGGVFAWTIDVHSWDAVGPLTGNTVERAVDATGDVEPVPRARVED